MKPTPRRPTKSCIRPSGRMRIETSDISLRRGAGSRLHPPFWKTRSSPNGSKAPFSRENEPGDPEIAREPEPHGPGALRPGEAFSGAYYPRTSGGGARLCVVVCVGGRCDGSPWLSGPPERVFRAGPRAPSAPGHAFPQPQPRRGGRRSPALRRPPATPQGDRRRRPDLTPPPPHLPPCPRRW